MAAGALPAAVDAHRPDGGPGAARALIIDTNIVLDLLLFGDPSALQAQAHLNAAMQARPGWRWIATAAMRAELAHVLSYRHLQPRMVFYQRSAARILQQFDHRALLVPEAPPAAVTCPDGDDQKFIDLAIAHQGLLLSRDHHVLRLRRKLALLGVQVACAMPGVQPPAALP